MLVPFQRKYLPFSEHDTSDALREWFSSEAGTTSLRSVVAAVERILPDLFGYHLVMVGDYIDRELVASSRISHQIIIGDRHRDNRAVSLVASQQALPLEENSVDVLVLPHTLDFSKDPHQLLREAERVLIGEGHMIVLSYNPWSFYGLWRGLLGWREGIPWRGRFISQTRIKDWLKLLGFDIEQAFKAGFRPPFKRAGVNRRFEFMEQLGAYCWPFFGNVSIIVAKKRVTSVTPLKTSWETRRRVLAGGGVVEPSTRNQRNAQD